MCQRVSSYNILIERWIPVRTLDNKRCKCSVYDLIQNAHLYKGFAAPVFHSITFYPYEYLLHCFICTLVSRILKLCKENLPFYWNQQHFDITMFEEYFEKWKDRFDLFHMIYPFLQTFQHDLEAWPKYITIKDGDVLSIFSASKHILPATSGNIFGLSVTNEEFVEHNKNAVDKVSVFTDKDKKQDVKNAITKCYQVSAEEWVYVVLFKSRIAPGIGQGYKTALAGNSSYWEILEGENLFQTILVNCNQAKACLQFTTVLL